LLFRTNLTRAVTFCWILLISTRETFAVDLLEFLASPRRSRHDRGNPSARL
jgi:hypothetical protein